MIIRSLKQHFPARFPEWLNADLLVLWGCYLLYFPTVFTDPRTAPLFAGMAHMAEPYGRPDLVWGIAAVTIGVVRWVALFVNGAWSRTPMIRLVMSFLSAFIWTQVVIAMKVVHIPMPTITIYAGLVFADICSAFRAACDVTYAECARRDSAEFGHYVGSRKSF